MRMSENKDPKFEKQSVSFVMQLHFSNWFVRQGVFRIQVPNWFISNYIG